MCYQATSIHIAFWRYFGSKKIVMAWIFSLWVAFDDDFQKNKTIEYFQDKIIYGNDDKVYMVEASDSGMITVPGISNSGIGSQKDADEMSFIGFELLRLLKSAPDFAYALVGIEVDGFADRKELLDDIDYYMGIAGIIISEKLYHEANAKYPLESFRNGYLWNPYQGEK
jgi:hypothetical protein